MPYWSPLVKTALRPLQFEKLPAACLVSHNAIPQRFGSKKKLWDAAVDHGFGRVSEDLIREAKTLGTWYNRHNLRFSMVTSFPGCKSTFLFSRDINSNSRTAFMLRVSLDIRTMLTKVAKTWECKRTANFQNLTIGYSVSFRSQIWARWFSPIRELSEYYGGCWIRWNAFTLNVRKFSRRTGSTRTNSAGQQDAASCASADGASYFKLFNINPHFLCPLAPLLSGEGLQIIGGITFVNNF